MQPPAQDALEFWLTNEKLRKANRKLETDGELLKLKGILIMLTHVKACSHRSCWDIIPAHKYLPAFNFGQMGMVCHWFEAI